MKLRIMGIDHQVFIAKDISRIAGHTGYLDSRLKEIQLDDSMHPEEMKRVLLHEVIEAIDRELAIHLDHEQQINKLDSGLFQVFSDNPHLLRYFLGEP